MCCSAELRMLEEELFNHCKLAEGDAKANSGRLLSELESMVTVTESSNAAVSKSLYGNLPGHHA